MTVAAAKLFTRGFKHDVITMTYCQTHNEKFETTETPQSLQIGLKTYNVKYTIS